MAVTKRKKKPTGIPIAAGGLSRRAIDHRTLFAGVPEYVTYADAPPRVAGRFGKCPPRIDYRTLRFADYLTPELPAPPASFDALDDVKKYLPTASIADLFPMDGNDQLGDCTCAGLAHLSTLYHALTGVRNVMSTPKVTALYRQLTGGPDSGLDLLTVLNYWRKHSEGATEIAAFVSVNPKNPTHVRQAMALFGGLYLGFQVPENCMAEFNAGTPWTPGKLTPDGHCVVAHSYTPQTFGVFTWGATQQGTTAWWTECVDECYAAVPPEAKSKKWALGFDYQQLMTDLQAVAG